MFVIQSRRPGKSQWLVIDWLFDLNRAYGHDKAKLRREAEDRLAAWGSHSADDYGFFRNWDFRITEM